jgi:Ni,Fe-hydrogenase III large subunit
MTRYIEVPVGPQHPALHEPIMLRVKLDDELVEGVDIITGYNHRGVEKLGEKNSWIRDIYIFSRICGICNAVHAQTYTQGVEKLMGVEPPPRARYIRTIVMELERIHSHMLINAVMAEAIGFDTLFMLIMRDREKVMHLKEIITGQRVHADIHMIGGVKRDLSPDKADKVLKVLDYVESRLVYYRKVFEEDYTVRKRLEGVGKISKSQALKHSLVGPVLRASGVPSDVRIDDPYAAYDELKPNIVVRHEGDSLARMLLRWDEALESVRLVRTAIENMPDGNPVPKAIKRVVGKGEVFSRVEAPRGELIYHIVSSGGPKPYRVKVRTPSFNNIVNSGFAYIGERLADVPVILTSFDPCISCTERVLVVDEKRGLRKWVPFMALSRGEIRVT